MLAIEGRGARVVANTPTRRRGRFSAMPLLVVSPRGILLLISSPQTPENGTDVFNTHAI
jgi:hypothetical protein